MIVTQHFSNDLLCFVFKNGFLLIASCKCVHDIVNNGLPQLEPIGVTTTELDVSVSSCLASVTIPPFLSLNTSWHALPTWAQ